MIGKSNDKYRQYLINQLQSEIAANKVWVFFTNDVRTSFTKVIDVRENGSTLEMTERNTIYKKKIETTELFKALRAVPGVTAPPNVDTISIGASTYYVSKTSGLSGTNSDTALWNAIYGKVAILEANGTPPKYYNTITVVLLDNTSGTINNNTVILSQTKIDKTTLPYNLNQHLQLLIQY